MTTDPTAAPASFGFIVERSPLAGDDYTWDDDGNRVSANPGWRVRLPHQCESWVIAGEEYGDGVPHADAIAELERFITEANRALAALRAEKPFDGSAR